MADIPHGGSGCCRTSGSSTEKAASAQGQEPELDFSWVDPYLDRVRPHFEVREEDALLIVLPNRAVKLNPTAVAILGQLKRGASIDEVLAPLGETTDRRADVWYFLRDFHSLLSGCLGEGRGRKAVRRVPHPRSFNKLPVLSEVALTYRCNLRCAFCYASCGCRMPAGGHRADSSSGEMTTRDVIRVLEIIRRDARVPSVSFTGGEPTLRPDLEELVAAAVARGLRVNLITNAALLAGADRAHRLRAAGLHSAQVSLEGPGPQVHERLTGVPGSFDRTLDGLKALRQAGVHVHTNTTLNSANEESIEAIIRLIADLGLERLSMNLIIPAGSASVLDLQVRYTRVGDLVERARAEAWRQGIEFHWYSPTPLCLYNPLAAGLGNKSCAACDGLLSVSPSGDVLPCSSYPEPVGNLLQVPFREIWKSARAEFFRQKEFVPRECRGCGDLNVCAGACPLYWSALGTAELAAAPGACGLQEGL